ncbi:unnamed protein product [Victoria cruziana]
MHGRRSLEPKLIPRVPDLQKHCRQQRAKAENQTDTKLGDQRPPPAGQLPQQEVPPPRLLREYFVPSDYDRGVGGVGPLVGPNQYEIKAATINMLPLFHGLATEDPY